MIRAACRWPDCFKPRCVPVYQLAPGWRVRCRFVYCRQHVDLILAGAWYA